MRDFFEMGGYGAYVWPAYGVSALVLFGVALMIWRRGKALEQKRRADPAANGDPEK